MDTQTMPAEEYVLVVIDMQFGFGASREIWLQKAVEAEILQARRANCPIVVLQMHPLAMHETYPVLTEHLQGYALHAVKEKHRDDGSDVIVATCAEMGFTRKLFRLCGVNTAACVWDTLLGLRKRCPGFRFQVVASACNCNSGFGYNDWGYFNSLPDVELLGLDLVRKRVGAVPSAACQPA